MSSEIDDTLSGKDWHLVINKKKTNIDDTIPINDCIDVNIVYDSGGMPASINFVWDHN